MRPPFVSVIIPAKNEEEYLKKTLPPLLDSVKNYTGDVELILIDNCSIDGTVRVAKFFGFQVYLVGIGSVSKMRNVGVQHAKGELIAFLDADCLVHPQWLSLCVGMLLELKLGAIATRAVPDFTNMTWAEEGWYLLISGAQRPTYPFWLGTSNLIVDRAIFDLIGGFNEQLFTAEDVDLTERIREHSPLYLEKRINTIHLRESKTLVELFKRESIRGRDSINQYLSSKERKKLLLSTFAPIFFVLLSVLQFVELFLFWNIYSMALFFISPGLFMLKKKTRINGVYSFAKVYMVAFVYLYSRGISSIFHFLKRNPKI